MKKNVRGTFLAVAAAALMVTGCGKKGTSKACSTIDSTMQNIAETAMMEAMREWQGETAEVIVMDVQTGDIKALVNLKIEDGDTIPQRSEENYAMTECVEMGGIFKPAAMMVALDDKKVTLDTQVDVGNCTYDFYGSEMRDASRRGGVMDLRTCFARTSHIGMARIIDENYADSAQAFVDGLRRVGMGIDLKIDGCNSPFIKAPSDSAWQKTTLPWMAIGYESLLTPMHICAFYNGIANKGVMVAPRLETVVVEENGKKMTTPATILVEKMCSEQTLKDMQELLYLAVSSKDGIGRKARCGSTRVCAFAGTSQLGTDKEGMVEYKISCCGSFPAESPRFTCYVGMRKKGLPASGGGMMAPVFSNIVNEIMGNNKSY